MIISKRCAMLAAAVQVQNGIPGSNLLCGCAYYDSYRSAVLPANPDSGAAVTISARTHKHCR